MKKATILLILSVIFIYGCSTEELQTFDSPAESLNQEAARGPVIHHASLGGNDLCVAFGLPNGCDKSFSLQANMFSDGSVKGQWQDGFFDERGIHVKIDCMIIIDNMAVLGGFVTKGTYFYEDVAGEYAVTAVVDNGNSTKDTPDLMSFSFVFTGLNNCDELSSFVAAYGPPPFIEVGKGQVTVW